MGGCFLGGEIGREPVRDRSRDRPQQRKHAVVSRYSVEEPAGTSREQEAWKRHAVDDRHFPHPTERERERERRERGKMDM